MNRAVCCFANGSYLKGAVVALKSFHDHCNVDCDYFLITDEPVDMPIYSWITTRYINKNRWSKIETRQDLFSSVCAKFEACKLPYDRIVVLDSDVLAIGDVSPLLSNEYKGYSIIAVPDYGSRHYYSDKLQELKLDADRIINAGMMIFQQEALQVDWLAEFSRLPASCSYDGGDQGYLNYYLQHVNPGLKYFMEDVKFNYALDAHYPACNSKAIIHFTGSWKPWLVETTESRYRNLFHKIWRTKFESALQGH